MQYGRASSLRPSGGSRVTVAEAHVRMASRLCCAFARKPGLGAPRGVRMAARERRTLPAAPTRSISTGRRRPRAGSHSGSPRDREAMKPSTANSSLESGGPRGRPDGPRIRRIWTPRSTTTPVLHSTSYRGEAPGVLGSRRAARMRGVPAAVRGLDRDPGETNGTSCEWWKWPYS